MKKRTPQQDEREKLVSNKIIARGLYLLCALLAVDFWLTMLDVQWIERPWNNVVFVAFVAVVICIERLCRNVFYDRRDTMRVRLVTLPLFVLAPGIAAAVFFMLSSNSFLEDGLLSKHGSVIIGLLLFMLFGICNAARIIYDLRKQRKSEKTFENC